MGNNISGYVSSYQLNPTNNLYTCQLTTITFPSRSAQDPFQALTPSTILGTGILFKGDGNNNIIITDKYSELPVTTITIDLLPINNDWNLRSPNDPNQMIIMSSDNKYIFFNRFFPPHKQFYKLLYAITKNNIRIPNIINYMQVGNYTPIDDGVYGKLTDDMDKIWYKHYLIAKNPPQELLKIDSNKNTWNDLSVIYKTYYDFNYNNTKYNIQFCYNYTTNINNPTFDPNNLISNTSCKSSINNGKTSKLDIDPISRPVQWYKSLYFFGCILLLLIIVGYFIIKSKKSE